MEHDKAEASDLIAERLMLLLQSLVDEVERRAVAQPGELVEVGDVLGRDGPAKTSFLEFADALREVSNVDLSLIEWVARVGEPPEIVIAHDDANAGGWPVRRRIA